MTMAQSVIKTAKLDPIGKIVAEQTSPITLNKTSHLIHLLRFALISRNSSDGFTSETLLKNTNVAAVMSKTMIP